MPKPVPIDLPQLAHFSIDEDGRLYWHGKAVQTESVVVLSGRQSTWAIVIAIATVVAALSSAASTGLAFVLIPKQRLLRNLLLPKYRLQHRHLLPRRNLIRNPLLHRGGES
jgi:hypothetical protein